MKINKDEFKKRMRQLLIEIKKSGLGHDPAETMRVVAQIRAWADSNPQFVDSLLYELPEPANTLVTHDPGFLVAESVSIGDTEFYLCEDCRFPMTSDEGCLICGDNFSDGRKVVLGAIAKVVKKDAKTYTRIAITASNIGIHQEPLNELLKLPEIYKGTVRPVLEQWYDVSDISMEIYISAYLRYMQEAHPQIKGLDPKSKVTETTETIGVKRATDTPIVGRSATLAIRQGPLDDILMLENACYDTIRPVLRKWYPNASEKSIDDYIWIYLRFMGNANYIDDDGHILKKLKEGLTTELKKELERGKPTKSAEVEGDKNARKSPVVESTPSLAIRQGPIDDILKLTIANRGTAFPVLRVWYPNATESTLKDYVYRYLRYLHKASYIDGEGNILKKFAEEQTEDEDIPEKDWKSNGVGEHEHTGRNKVEDIEPDLIHPIRDDLTVVTIKNKIEIYLEPLNEILQLERIDDMTLQRVLVKYYDVSRVSFLVAIKGTWKGFLREEGYIDEHDKPTCKEVIL